MRLALLLGTIGIGLAGACSGSHEPRYGLPSVAVVPLHSGPLLDVPSLLKLRVEEVQQRIGPPRPVPPAFQDHALPAVAIGPVDSTALFQYQGLNVVVSYNYSTRQISDLLLVGSNEEELMGRGNLETGSLKYPQPQEQRRPTQLLGLRVFTLATPQ